MDKNRHGNFFENFHLGQRILHGTPRTVTDGDASAYIALTGTRNLLSSAVTAARLAQLDRRPIDDLLVFNIAFGKTVPEISLNAVANLGYAEVQFLEPVFPGDTLRCESHVIGLKENSNRRSGVVYVRSSCHNQNEQIVLTWVRWVMVNKADQTSVNFTPQVPQLRPFVPANVLTVTTAFTPNAISEWCAFTNCNDLWGDYEKGELITHPLGMTVEEADHMSATRLYQNNSRPHFDALAMKDSHVGRRLVYGGHVISICRALSYEGLENVVGILAINSGAHVSPTLAGDTIYARTEIIEQLEIPERSDIGALRLRTLGLRNWGPSEEFNFEAAKSHNSTERSQVVLDVDYVVSIPRRSHEN